jgi:multidrug efflux pump subunit AcrB
VFSVVGTSFSRRGRESAADPATVGQVTIQLVSSEEREASGLRGSEEIVADMRARLAEFTGVRSLTVTPQAGGPGGNDIEIRVRGADFDQVQGAVAAVRDELATFSGVDQIEDDLRTGKLEARVRLRDSARSLGLTTRDVAMQLRHALFGFEAQDLQEQAEEVTVRAVLPEAARTDLSDLSRLRIDTPSGARVPLEEVAEVVTERGYASLARVDGQRAVTVTADIDQTRANSRDVTAAMHTKFDGIGRRFPGVSLSFEGDRKAALESVGSLAIGFPVALLAIYALLAVLFGSYLQPILVMAAIPYALVGAVLGHWITGYPLTFLSMIGSVALAGIVVNDSLILVDFINRERRAGKATLEAVVSGGRSRLRAILLTSITTIAGLGPLMLETSFQAQFLIPMAVAIVYGLAFATGVTLLLLPTIYVVGEDVRASAGWLVTGTWKRRLPEVADIPA